MKSKSRFIYCFQQLRKLSNYPRHQRLLWTDCIFHVSNVFHMSTYHRWKYYTVRICAYQNTSPSSITNLGHDNQHIDQWKKMHILEYFAANCYCGVLGRVSYHIKNVSSAKLGVRKYKIHRKLILHNKIQIGMFWAVSLWIGSWGVALASHLVL